jgi:molybdopterin synthase sulfur carrier subunit
MYGKKFEDKVYKNQELTSEVIILLNGRHITHYDGIDTKLAKDDEISIFPVVAGG